MTTTPYPSNRAPGFIACSLERRAEWRNDSDQLESMLADARLIPLNRYRMPMHKDELLSLPIEHFQDRLEQAIWLGVWQGVSHYALAISDEEAAAQAELRFTDLRGAAMRLQPDHAAVMAYARAMVFWHQRHQFCGRCGGKTAPKQAGHVLHCAQCDLEHYPRSDPSMLVQVSDEQDRCLLGRQAGWPASLWSVLAGFVEPGESIEDAVVREVWEEARVQVTGMNYVASQPWPFPASVLMGFHASASNCEPQVEQDELEAADWFSREQVVQGVRSKALFLPPPFTLSFQLIERWFDRGNLDPLRPLLGIPA